MKRFLSASLVFLLFGLFGVTAYIISQTNSNLSVDETDALYGGRPEFGYTSAGFLINQVGDATRLCGYSAISPDTAITAAHCVDDAVKIYLGKNQYSTDFSQTVEVKKAIQKDGWVDSELRSDDFSVLKFDTTEFFTSFAEVATPIEGCFYRIVAYGRTETGDDNLKQRKSSKLCIFDIQQDTFKIRGDDSGICYGDSGSPIYFDGTNKVVGVTVSIVLENEQSVEPCSFGNTAIAVRTDVNNRLIQDNVETKPDSSALDINNRLTIEVAEETFLERIGLPSLQNLTIREKTIYYLVAIFVVIIFLIILTIVLLLRPDPNRRHA